MDEVWQQQIRERAIAIWEREGRPAGDYDQFNAMAEQELVAEGQTPSSSPLDGHGDPDEAEVDEALDKLFPASDPSAWTSETGVGERAHPSPITCFHLAMAASARARFVYPDAFCQPIRPCAAMSWR